MASRSQGRIIEFHYDISCPFAYIASTKIEALSIRTGARIIWRPVLLGAIYRATSAPQGAGGSASDVFNVTKKEVSNAAFQRTIKRHGIPHRQPPRHPMKTTAALRLLYFVDQADRPALTHALFRAYWVEGKEIGEKATLIEAVRSAGVGEAERIVEAVESGSFEGQRERKLLEGATNDAVQRGSPGVPGFWIPEQKRLYWGQDRMHLVEAAIQALNEGHNPFEISKISKPLQSLLSRAKRAAIPEGKEVKVEFWYDFSSPWAFLGWTQLARLQRQFGSRLQIDMKPFLLGILFREIGAPNTPSAAISEQKRNYMNQDHKDWYRWWNAVNAQTGNHDKNIDFYWADNFPIRTPTLLRVALVEPRLTTTFYRACWEQNLDMSDDNVVAKVIDQAGFDGKTLIAKSNEAEYKSELRARTKEAKDAGMCGVPTYRVYRRKEGQGEEAWTQTGGQVWGQDELAVVEDLIAGWDGDSVATVDEGGSRSGSSRL
ncbi:DSBA oxidoreductase like protein [Zymoseptoria brevis]|uniref:DSBA oxidoreductase like protein n=1 Tax=Zymoseptoria brevis TaxID=1047168 RepID=A0A0F4G6I8_9PEZI|nr:DSBA oxidoreductase like protein [Zymoseptoria brevis]